MTKEELEIAKAACCVGTIWDQYEGTEKFNEMVGKRVQHLIALVRNHLQQEQPEGNLEYWLEHFGMPKENIDNCITQIAQGYGACRYLEGIQHGAEAVNELAKQEQPEVDYNIIPLPEERMASYIAYCLGCEDDDCNCPTCGKHVTGLRLFPYYYDRENNDVYFASVCPECGKIIISKE